ncbi:MAG: hypothetical protein DRN53_07630, partial [Thermoprotei archaeon]
FEERLFELKPIERTLNEFGKNLLHTERTCDIGFSSSRSEFFEVPSDSLFKVHVILLWVFLCKSFQRKYTPRLGLRCGNS